ncbi:hypothetical protein [Pseudanabaena sp. ABRG5-3]|uniref:hypothetical protein n=1 Tax=Pseudanabaena sp. ABRG5-3 TaxID=685565 RepID=UPI000F83B063|nr:hypothetical protein [Pseudanabaena sp. ABRG5-3]
MAHSARAPQVLALVFNYAQLLNLRNSAGFTLVWRNERVMVQVSYGYNWWINGGICLDSG